VSGGDLHCFELRCNEMKTIKKIEDDGENGKYK